MATMIYRIFWRDYRAPKAVGVFWFGSAEIGDATWLLSENRKHFAEKGLSMEFWLEPV